MTERFRELRLRLGERLVDHLEMRALASHGMDNSASVDSSFSALRDYLKACIDSADLPAFTEILRRWRIAVSAEYRADPDAALRQEFEHAVFPLVVWTTHRHGSAAIGQEPLTTYTAMLRQLAGTFSSPTALRNAGPKAEDEPWGGWVLSELPSHEAHFLPSRPMKTRAINLVALLRNFTDEGDPPYTPSQLRFESQDLLADLTSLKEDAPRWNPLLGNDDDANNAGVSSADHSPVARETPGSLEVFRQRVDRLCALIERGRTEAERQRKIEVRDAPIDREALEAFRRDVVDALRKAGEVRELLIQHGTTQTVPTPDEGGRALKQWIPKAWFVKDDVTRIIGPIANDFAREFRREQTRQLTEVLEALPFASGGEASTAERLRSARTAMSALGIEPDTLVVGDGWRLQRALKENQSWRGTRLEDWEGLRVVRSVGLRDDDVFLVNLREAMVLERWGLDPDTGSTVSFDSFDLGAARRFASEHPEIGGGQLSEEELVEYLQDHLLLTITVDWAIAPRERPAGVRVTMADDH